MVTARDSRKQLEALRGAIADDAVELRLWWEEARGKAVREWRGLSAVAREILSLVPFQVRREATNYDDAFKAPRDPAPAGTQPVGAHKSDYRDGDCTPARTLED
jgi:hypothetical protein